MDRLVDGGGELEAARLMSDLGKLQDPAMALAYRLHDIAAKKGRAADQERYNALISSWTELIRLSGDGSVTRKGCSDMAALTNKERVGRVLDLVAEGLGPWMVTQLACQVR